MRKVINLYKPTGITPLQAVKAFKKRNPSYKNKKMAYAGRLDPLAEGVLLLLVEPETKNRNKYQNLDKTYEFKLLFGINTDTGDILGKIVKKYDHKKTLSKNNLQIELEKLLGESIQKFPAYSSKTAKGKPLYWWARQNRLNEINFPKKKIKIYNIKLKKISLISASKLRSKIFNLIDKVQGDFRQKEILESWDKFFRQSKSKSLNLATISISCSSGTYIRVIAEKIGKNIGTGGLALEIVRTSVGEYKLSDSIKLNLP